MASHLPMRKQRTLLVRYALPSLALFTLASLAHAADTSVIARVGGKDITVAEIEPYLSKVESSDREKLLKNPAALNQIVRKLIAQQLIYKEAVASGWDKQPEVIAQLDQLKQGAIAETYLQSVAKVPDNYPSAADVEATFQARKASLIVPRQLLISQIFIPRPAEAAEVEKASDRVEALAKSLKQPNADFKAIAQSVNDDPQGQGRGGEIGWLAETDIQPEIRSRLAGLPKNGITEIIKQADGWYILKVSDIKESRPATLDEVRDQITQLLRNERARLNREAYLAKIQQQNPISINELDLSKLLTAGQN